MKKILIVDDEADVCDFVKGFFEERGFEVIMALSGTEALRVVKKQKPSLILLDIKMKGIDGIETLKRIRALDKNVNVMMVTAADDKGTMDKASKLGACKYISKPLVLENLESAVMSFTKGVKSA